MIHSYREETKHIQSYLAFAALAKQHAPVKGTICIAQLAR
jgi:hypothetical protein